MRRHLVLATVLVLTLALLGAVLPGVAAAKRSRPPENVLMKEHILLLKGYIEDWAEDNGGSFPTGDAVWWGGDLPAPLWPSDPWASGPLSAGSTVGRFTYEVAPDQLSFTLTGHLEGGFDYTVGGTSAGPPTSAAVRDAAVRTGVCLIERFMMDYAAGTGTLPEAAVLDPDSLLGDALPTWPLSPFDGQKMQPGSGPGQFSYTPAGDGSYALVAHLTSGDYTRTGPAYDWASGKNQLTRQGVNAIATGVELWSLLNNDAYPPVDEIAATGGVSMFVDPWPRNPFTGQAMNGSGARGDFTYTADWNYAGYTLLANLTGGQTYDAGEWTSSLWEPMHRLRVSLKDLCAQGYAQVLKDYIDEWALGHGGVLPTTEEMDPDEAVGWMKTWWPTNPWTLGPMVPGTNLGDYEYTPNEDGGFTLVLHQEPLPDQHGIPGSGYPSTYTAQ